MASGFLQVHSPVRLNSPVTPLSEADEFYSVASSHDGSSTEGPPDYEHERDRDDEPGTLQPPTHPVPSMQTAFEESIEESTQDSHTVRQSLDVDANARRKKLLERADYDNAWTSRWKQSTRAQHHPLLKQMAQIIFGMHLLQQQQAKSDEEVVKILQTHVDEIDNFLEQTTQDFDLAIGDIEERLRYLKLPMTHLEVFETMLEDKKFRTQLLDGNDKIEKIIDRTTKAMQGSMHDIRKGKDAAKELGKYLVSIHDTWPGEKEDLAAIYGAMRGNEDGWKKALTDLQTKGHNLGDTLNQLTGIIGEMARLAAAASRRDKVHARSISSSQSEPGSPKLRSKFNRGPPPSVPRANPAFFNKPLPVEPDTAGGAPRRSMSKPHPVPFAERYESPRKQPPTPQSPPGSPRSVKTVNGVTPRSRTAGNSAKFAREARMTSKRETAELAEFLKHSGPLSSNPPDPSYNAKRNGAQEPEEKLTRSRSQGAVDVLNAAKNPHVNGHIPRSQSQGASTMLFSRPKTSGSDSVMSQPRVSNAGDTASRTSSQNERRDSNARTAFARRMSKRMRHLPIPEHERALETKKQNDNTNNSNGVSISNSNSNKRGDLAIQPADSAYGSGADTKTSSPETQKRQALGLFPVTNPLNPSAASLRNASNTTLPLPMSLQGVVGGGGGGAGSVRGSVRGRGDSGASGAVRREDSITALPTQHPSPPVSRAASKSRTFSIRNVFHRKKVSGVF